jgi:hypothetical protein
MSSKRIAIKKMSCLGVLKKLEVNVAKNRGVKKMSAEKIMFCITLSINHLKVEWLAIKISMDWRSEQ